MRYFRPAVLVTALSCAACSVLFQGEQQVTVLCPPPPIAWQIAFPGLEFRVETRDARGALRETGVADWRVPAVVSCAKDLNSPILAWPYEPGNRQSPVHATGLLRPAGGFFPLSLRASGNREVVELTWADGAAALVVSRVAATGRDVSLFNVSRLCGFFREEGEPWALDLDAIAQRISVGDFTAWNIDPLPSWDAEVEPGAGTWFLETPFDQPRDALNGRIQLSHCTRGIHRLFSLAGPCWKMVVRESGSCLLPVE